MAEPEEQVDHLFMQLVLSLQMGAWQQLGKIASPITGKVERDLAMAKLSIDMLAMIRNKTQGNLSAEEQRVIDHILYELRLNYVDESSKGGVSSEGGEGAEQQAGNDQADQSGQHGGEQGGMGNDGGTQ